MIRKTMRIGEVRTSIKLEEEFWGYLKEISEARSIRLSALVNEIARATPDRTNLASTLRTFALIHSTVRIKNQQAELDKLQLAGNTQDLVRMMDGSPLPSLIVADDRAIRRVNRSFTLWLNLAERALIGQRVDNIMILRAQGINEMWDKLYSGEINQASFTATYVSPGKVRTSQAAIVGLAKVESGRHRAAGIIFETLVTRS